MVRLTDHPDMTLDVYSGRKTTKQYNTMLWNSIIFLIDSIKHVKPVQLLIRVLL